MNPRKEILSESDNQKLRKCQQINLWNSKTIEELDLNVQNQGQAIKDDQFSSTSMSLFVTVRVSLERRRTQFLYFQSPKPLSSFCDEL